MLKYSKYNYNFFMIIIDLSHKNEEYSSILRIALTCRSIGCRSTFFFVLTMDAQWVDDLDQLLRRRTFPEMSWSHFKSFSDVIHCTQSFSQSENIGENILN